MKIMEHEHKMERRVDATGPYQRCARDGCELERDYPDPRSMVVEYDELVKAAHLGR